MMRTLTRQICLHRKGKVNSDQSSRPLQKFPKQSDAPRYLCASDRLRTKGKAERLDLTRDEIHKRTNRDAKSLDAPTVGCIQKLCVGL